MSVGRLCQSLRHSSEMPLRLEEQHGGEGKGTEIEFITRRISLVRDAHLVGTARRELQFRLGPPHSIAQLYAVSSEVNSPPPCVQMGDHSQSSVQTSAAFIV